LSDLRFLRELGAELERVAPASGRWRARRRARAVWPDRRSVGGVVMVAMAVLATAAVAAVFLIALGAVQRDAAGSRVARPVGGPVPEGFQPRALTAISSRRWWVLGERPCSPKACLAIVRTTDGGRSFVSISAPPVHYASAGCPYAPVSQLRFADQRDGFAYGCALYVTHDGGGHWRKLDLGGDVSQLATAGGEAYAIVSDTHGPGTSKLMRSPVGKDAWTVLPAPSRPGQPPVGNGLAARGSDVYVLSFGSSILWISHNRGASFSRSSLGSGLPCTIQPATARVVWAFCSGGTNGAVLRSTDGGQTFRGADGGPNAQGEYHGAVFAASGPANAVVGFGQLLATSDAGRSYSPIGPAVAQWESLVFTDAYHGVGLAFPTDALTDARVYVTDDGGDTFHVVPIGSPAPVRPRRPYGVSCHSSQLLLAFGPGVSEATEQNTLVLDLHNQSTRGCDLRGYPNITLLDGRGARLPFSVQRHGDQMLTGRPPAFVSVPPGGDAYLGLNKNTCEAGTQRSAAEIRVVPPQQRQSLSALLPHYPILGYCTVEPGHIVDITPIEATVRAVSAVH
jgi:photosystem II stability/assembly factor-like uncharacterized protein